MDKTIKRDYKRCLLQWSTVPTLPSLPKDSSASQAKIGVQFAPSQHRFESLSIFPVSNAPSPFTIGPYRNPDGFRTDLNSV